MRQPRFPLAALALTSAFTSLAVAQDWTTLPATGPTGRQLPRMAHDLSRNRVVLFGGYERTMRMASAETWLFDGSAWTRAMPNTVPAPRDTHAMSFDSGRGVIVMFGGVDSGNFPTSLNNETWEWNGVDWQRRTPAVSPSPRFGMAMAYDSTRRVHVMFGGATASSYLAETWEYDGTTWTQRSPGTAPAARTNHGMAYDARRGRVVLFGGSSGTTRLGDTWEYDGTSWQQIVRPVMPRTRTGCGLAYDVVRGVCVLFGGLDGVLLSDTWDYDGRHWYDYRLEAVPGNAPRTNVAMTYMLTRRSVVLFGGAGASDLGDTAEFGGTLPSFAAFADGCTGSAGKPALDTTTLPGLGQTLSLRVTPTPSNAFTFLILGLGGLGSVPLPGTLCELQLLPPWFLVGAPASGNTASFPVPIPNAPGLAGLNLPFQAAVFDPPANSLGLTVSNAARAVPN